MVGNYWTTMKQALTVKCQKDLYKNQTSDNHGFLSLPIGYFPGYVGRLGDPTKVECGGILVHNCSISFHSIGACIRIQLDFFVSR